MRPPETVEPPRVTIRSPEDELTRALREAQWLLLEHPVAAQALFRAFVAEGRAFGETAEGRRLREELRGSELIRRGRVVWEVSTLNLLEEDEETVLPSKLLDAIVFAASTRELEPMLSRLFEGTWEGTHAR
jgi:plasmid stabilization system protein ParE